MMVLRGVISALLALQVTAMSMTGSSLACTESVQDDTISFFSHAPLTFSFEVPSVLACAEKCSGVSSCRAWLYSSSGQECQLYREQPLYQARNPLFVSGVCVMSSVSPSGVYFSLSSIPAPSSQISVSFSIYSFTCPPPY